MVFRSPEILSLRPMTRRPCRVRARRERKPLQKIRQLLSARSEYIVVGRKAKVSRRRMQRGSRVSARRRSARNGIHGAKEKLGGSLIEGKMVLGIKRNPSFEGFRIK